MDIQKRPYSRLQSRNRRRPYKRYKHTVYRGNHYMAPPLSVCVCVCVFWLAMWSSRFGCAPNRFAFNRPYNLNSRKQILIEIDVVGVELFSRPVRCCNCLCCVALLVYYFSSFSVEIVHRSTESGIVLANTYVTGHEINSYCVYSWKCISVSIVRACNALICSSLMPEKAYTYTKRHLITHYFIPHFMHMHQKKNASEYISCSYSHSAMLCSICSAGIRWIICSIVVDLFWEYHLNLLAVAESLSIMKKWKLCDQCNDLFP